MSYRKTTIFAVYLASQCATMCRVTPSSRLHHAFITVCPQWSTVFLGPEWSTVFLGPVWSMVLLGPVWSTVCPVWSTVCPVWITVLLGPVWSTVLLTSRSISENWFFISCCSSSLYCCICFRCSFDSDISSKPGKITLIIGYRKFESNVS